MNFKPTLMSGTAAIVVTLALTLMASAQDKPAPNAASNQSPKKIVGDAHKKTPAHDRLAEMLGVWDVTMTVVPAPGQAPREIKSIATRTPMYDGKLIKEEAVWNIPGMGGENHFTFLYGYNSGTLDFEKMEVGQDTTQINLLTGPWDGKANQVEIRSHTGPVSFTMGETTTIHSQRTVIHFDDIEYKSKDGKSDRTERRERHITHTTMGDSPEFLQWTFTYTKRKLPAPDMSSMAAHMTPGKPHEVLAAMIGEFEFEMNYKLSSMPDAMLIKGKSTRTWKIPGLIVEDTMEIGPMKMYTLFGYHNGTKEYEVTYIHPQNSSIERMVGSVDANGTLTTTGMVWDGYMGERVLQTSTYEREVDGVAKGSLTLKYNDFEFATNTLKWTRIKSADGK